MAATHQVLVTALRQRLGIIADREAYSRDPAAHLEQLKTVSETIEELRNQLPRPLDPQLNHYLEKCSYDKALAFLESSGESAR